MRNFKAVNEHTYGVYAWGTESGAIYDFNGERFCVASRLNDIQTQAALTRAAKAENLPPGIPVWIGGARKISESEYQMQVDREKEGLIADPYDFKAVESELRANAKR